MDSSSNIELAPLTSVLDSWKMIESPATLKDLDHFSSTLQEKVKSCFSKINSKDMLTEPVTTMIGRVSTQVQEMQAALPLEKIKLEATKSIIDTDPTIIDAGPTITELTERFNAINTELANIKLYKEFVATFQADQEWNPILNLFTTLSTQFFSLFNEKIMAKIFKGSVTLRKAHLNTELASVKSKIENNADKLKNLEAEKLEKNSSSPSQDTTALEQQIKTLHSTDIELQNAKQAILDKLTQIEEDLEKSADVRLAFRTIGSEQVKIVLPKEDVTLDGMYVSCDAFKETLKKSKAQAFQLSATRKDDGKSVQLKGIAMPKDQIADSEIMKALEKIGAFSVGDKPGAGWTQIEHGDYILFVPDEEAGHLQSTDEEWDLTVKFEEIETTQSTQGGTVLMTSGALGVYEMHKREIFAFLLSGMDVLTINFRGYGSSTGTPTEKGLERDLEAAYDYLQKKHPVPDDKILCKGLCLSGGPVAALAAKHPKVNLFLDQTYSSFVEMINEEVTLEIEKIKKSLDAAGRWGKGLQWGLEHTQWLIQKIIGLATPNWQVASNLSFVNGKICLSVASKDDMLSLSHLEKNMASIKTGSEVTVIGIEGPHGSSWVNPKFYPVPFTIVDKDAAKKIAVKTGLEWDEEHFISDDEMDLEALLMEHYQDLVDLDDGTRSPQFFWDRIHQMSFSVAPEVQDVLRNFLLRTFKFRDEFVLDARTEKDRQHYYVRKQVHHFLNKAGLMADFV